MEQLIPKLVPTCQHKHYLSIGAAVFVQDLDVGVVLARRSPLSGTALLLPVLKKLWVAKNSHAAALIHQSKCGTAVQPLFIFMSC